MFMLSMLAAAASPIPPPVTPPVPDERAITVTLSSWGHPIAGWRIEGDGSIVYRRAAKPMSVARPTPVVTQQAGPSAARYRWVRDQLAPARRWAGKTLPCKMGVTDQPYGQVHWGSGASLDFSTGCTDATTRAVTGRIARTTDQVEAWSRVEPAKARP